MSKKDKPLYRVVVEPGGGYGKYPKYHRFWHIEKWNKKHKQYFKHGNGGLAFTEWGLRRAVRKELRRINAGYTVQHFTINGVRID